MDNPSILATYTASLEAFHETWAQGLKLNAEHKRRERRKRDREDESSRASANTEPQLKRPHLEISHTADGTANDPIIVPDGDDLPTPRDRVISGVTTDAGNLPSLSEPAASGTIDRPIVIRDDLTLSIFLGSTISIGTVRGSAVTSSGSAATEGTIDHPVAVSVVSLPSPTTLGALEEAPVFRPTASNGGPASQVSTEVLEEVSAPVISLPTVSGHLPTSQGTSDPPTYELQTIPRSEIRSLERICKASYAICLPPDENTEFSPCPICLNPGIHALTVCGHAFCGSCLFRWCQQNCGRRFEDGWHDIKCPFCRQCMKLDCTKRGCTTPMSRPKWLLLDGERIPLDYEGLHWKEILSFWSEC